MLTCKECEEQCTIDELVEHPDVDAISINDYVWCPNCKECKEFTSEQGNLEF